MTNRDDISALASCGQNDNRIVQGLWVGGRLTELERLCIRSFCANGHEFHLYHYDELQNLPKAAGLRLLNAEEILPRTAIFRHYRNQSLACFSDHFRWKLLQQNGGWWADMDMICLRPLDFAAPLVLCGESDDVISIGMIKCPPGHCLANAMADACDDINAFVPWDTRKRKRLKIKRRLLFRNAPKYQGWGEVAGPTGMTLAARYLGLCEYKQPVHVFYPVYLHSAALLYGGERDASIVQSTVSDSHAVHFWNEIARRRGINKDGKFPENSLYEILKRRYPEPQ